MRTVPVKYSAGPFAEACEPLRLISMSFPFLGAGQITATGLGAADFGPPDCDDVYLASAIARD